MKTFIEIMGVWFLFAITPVLVSAGFISFVTMDPSFFNPVYWHEGVRFLSGAWVIIATVAMFDVFLKIGESHDV